MLQLLLENEAARHTAPPVNYTLSGLLSTVSNCR
jgi:hypothetical protein